MSETKPDVGIATVGAEADDPETILVPLDGSETAKAVLPIARAGAMLLDAPIHILHVAQALMSKEEVLETLGLSADDVAGMTIEQAEGDVAAAILREADVHHCRLIVMSAQGMTCDPGCALGHVAAEVLSRATCSLVLLRTDVALRLLQERHVLARILIPLDGTPTTAAALSPAAEIAARSGASLDVLHVATSGHVPPEPGTMTVAPYQDSPHHELDAWRREFSTRFLGQFARASTKVHLAAGDPAAEILRAARERQSDLVVLVWKGELAPDRARTVQALLADAPCPLLFLRTRASLGLPAGVVEVRASPLRSA